MYIFVDRLPHTALRSEALLFHSALLITCVWFNPSYVSAHSS